MFDGRVARLSTAMLTLLIVAALVSPGAAGTTGPTEGPDDPLLDQVWHADGDEDEHIGFSMVCLDLSHGVNMIGACLPVRVFGDASMYTRVDVKCKNPCESLGSEYFVFRHEPKLQVGWRIDGAIARKERWETIAVGLATVESESSYDDHCPAFGPCSPRAGGQSETYLMHVDAGPCAVAYPTDGDLRVCYAKPMNYSVYWYPIYYYGFAAQWNTSIGVRPGFGRVNGLWVYAGDNRDGNPTAGYEHLPAELAEEVQGNLAWLASLRDGVDAWVHAQRELTCGSPSECLWKTVSILDPDGIPVPVDPQVVGQYVFNVLANGVDVQFTRSVQRQALAALVLDQLLLQEAIDQGIQMSPEALELEVAKLTDPTTLNERVDAESETVNGTSIASDPQVVRELVLAEHRRDVVLDQIVGTATGGAAAELVRAWFSEEVGGSGIRTTRTVGIGVAELARFIGM